VQKPVRVLGKLLKTGEIQVEDFCDAPIVGFRLLTWLGVIMKSGFPNYEWQRKTGMSGQYIS
jgi:hypothetical protein